jgi:predicted aldo/keto reductase-like oxidoreductase
MKRAHDNGIAQIAMKTQGVVEWMHGDPNTHHPAALKWVMQNEFIGTAVPGFTTFDQLEEDMIVARDIVLTDEEKNYLNNFKDFRYGVKIQCEQCGLCMNSCPNQANVPDLMRTYMYAAGYHNYVHSRETYELISEKANLSNCENCRSCKAECARGIDIASNIRQLKAIYC